MDTKIVNLITDNNEYFQVDTSNPLLKEGFFAVIDLNQSTGFSEELLNIIFNGEYVYDLNKILTYIPVLSSLSMRSHVLKYYEILFAIIKKTDQWNIIDELLTDMQSYYAIDEFDRMPDQIAVKFIRLCDSDIINAQDIFFAAIKIGYLEVVKYLASKGADIHANNNHAVQWASLYGHLEVVKYLVNSGANIRAYDDYAVQLASSNGHLVVVEYLVSIGADIHGNNDCAAQLASLNGHLEVVKYLVSKGVKTCDLIVLWASERGHLEVVKYLVSKGADIRAYYDYAVQRASSNGHLEVVKYLVGLGANVHVYDDYAVRQASKNGYSEVVKYLVSLGAKL